MNTALRLTVAVATVMTLAGTPGLFAGQCSSGRPSYGGGYTTQPYPYASAPIRRPDPFYAQPGCTLERCATASGSLDNWLPEQTPVGSQNPVGQQTGNFESPAENVVTPQVPDADLPILTAGETLPVAGVAEARGRAQLRVGGLLLNLTVLDWQGGTATIQLPDLSIDNPVRSELRMLTASGELQRAVEVMLDPGKTSPASSEPPRPTIVAGEDLTLADENIGMDRGQVKLKLSGVAINVEILDWRSGEIAVRWPNLPLTEAVNAELQVLNADGSEVANKAVTFAPAQS